MTLSLLLVLPLLGGVLLTLLPEGRSTLVRGLAAAVALAQLAVGLLAWRLNAVLALRRCSRWLAALTGLQLATGLGNVVLGWPILAALLHTGGAAALLLVLTWALAWSRRP